jgi:hypothetical protein
MTLVRNKVASTSLSLAFGHEGALTSTREALYTFVHVAKSIVTRVVNAFAKSDNVVFHPLGIISMALWRSHIHNIGKLTGSI